MKNTIDTTGLSCPQPLLMVKKAMDALGSGEITVLADSEASRENISRAALKLGWEKRGETANGPVWTMEFHKG